MNASGLGQRPMVGSCEYFEQTEELHLSAIECTWLGRRKCIQLSN